ncbi:MAG: DNA repair protein RecO [Bacteroidia bacterium]
MLVKTQAIVLRNTNFRENSIISKMYTREFGIRSYIFHSIRKGKSAIRPSMIQPLSLVDMEVYEKAGTSINKVKELRNVPLLLSTQGDMYKKSIALFLVEILNNCLTEEMCDEELFVYIRGQILKIENKDVGALFSSVFLIGLSKYLGVEPQGHFSEESKYFDLEEGVFVAQEGLNTLDNQTSLLISLILHSQENDLPSIKTQVRRDTLNALIKYYQIHIMKYKEIKSVQILSELLE